MAANTFSGLAWEAQGTVFEVWKALAGDSDETVSKNNAGPSKTHETVSKEGDWRRKAYDLARDCRQKQPLGEPPEA